MKSRRPRPSYAARKHSDHYLVKEIKRPQIRAVSANPLLSLVAVSFSWPRGEAFLGPATYGGSGQQLPPE